MSLLTRLLSFLPKVALFVVMAAVGAGAASIAVAALRDRTPVSSAGEAPDYLLAGAPDTPGGSPLPVAFNLEPGPSPAVLPTLAPDDLALAADSLLSAQPASYVKPAGFPRIPPITQFDGSPFANANCTLASGAMLARLAYGIETRPWQLRQLQDDQDGGVGLDDLQTALWRGYGVAPKTGLIRPAQLKSLLGAGYGAVIQGDYSKIPVSLRLQKDFTGGHAIYLDGYYPGSAKRGIPEAYYVIDPIGRPASGYDGDWWPASVVDAFATGFGGGRVAAMWAFPPGGVPPEVVGPDVLPIPPGGGGAGGKGGKPTPSPSAGATPEPSSSASVPPIIDFEPGDTGPVSPADEKPVDGDVSVGDVITVPILELCLITPVPAACPPGVEATFDGQDPPIISVPAGPSVNALFVDSDRPDVAIVGFTVDPPIPATVRFWEADGTPATIGTPSSMSSITLFGSTVLLARLDVHAATAYHFQAVAGDGLLAGLSPVGTFTTGDGVEQFNVALSAAAKPTFQLATGLSPYLRLAPGAYAQPMLPLSGLGASNCLESAVYGGTGYCVNPGDLPAAGATCTRAEVTYALSGIDADGVLVRAFPTQEGVTPGGEVTLDGVLEASGDAPSGTLSIGCLAPGLSYQVVLDAIGDDRGILAAETVTAP